MVPAATRRHSGTQTNQSTDVFRGGFVMTRRPHHPARLPWYLLAGILRPMIFGVLIPFVIPLRAAATIVNLNADQDNTMYAENSLNS